MKRTTGLGVFGISTGSTLNGKCLGPNLIMDSGNIERKRPEASRLLVGRGALDETVAFGATRPLARNASAIDEEANVPACGKIQGSRNSSESLILLWLSHLLAVPAATTSRSSKSISGMRFSSLIGSRTGPIARSM